MKDIREQLGQRLNQEDIDVLEIVQIPMNGDRMVRLRTLEETLNDFENTQNGETINYLIQVKTKNTRAAAPIETPTQRATQKVAQASALSNQATKAAAPTSNGDNEYMGDGNLNIPFLAKNADLLLSVGDYPLAKNIYKAILASGERSGLALFGIGQCAEAEGHLEEAQKCYEESIAYHPQLQSYQRLALVFMAQQKDQSAAEVLERTLTNKELAPEMRFEIHKTCGNCWTRARVTANAERHFTAALEIDPTADEIRSNLGALYLQDSNIPAAKRNFEDALASNSNNDKALIGLGSCHLAEGDKRKAHDLFAQALEANLNNSAAVYHLVKCAYDIRSYATAARLVEEYIQIAPVNANLLYSLAGLQFHLGRANDARATANQILSLNAEHSGAKELVKLIDRFSN